MSSSDEGDFLGLEERMSFEEDMAPQEPLVQEELQGAQGGQEVALRGPQLESLTAVEAPKEAEPPAPPAPPAPHVSQPEIPEADPWTFARPMGTVDVRTKHPLTGEWVVPQDYDHVFDQEMDRFRQMTADEIAPYRRSTNRPKEPRQASARDQPDLPSRAGSYSSEEPWRQDPLWKCVVKRCDHPGTYSFLALKKHFMRWHQPQRVEYVCPFGGYRCPLQPCSANPVPAMVRRHTKRHHCGVGKGLERALTELPYVVVDNLEMVDPGDLPRFPRNPQSGALLRDWPFSLETAGPRWTTESVVPPNRSRRAPTELSQCSGSAGSQSRNVRPIHRHSQPDQRRAGAVAPTFITPPPTRTSFSRSTPVGPMAQPRREMALLQPSSSGPQQDFRREKQEIFEQSLRAEDPRKRILTKPTMDYRQVELCLEICLD